MSSESQIIIPESDSEVVHHELASKKRARPRGVAQMNLSSMLDVCFQLLIFFVLTATFAVGEGVLPADLPTGSGAPSDEAPPELPLKILLKSLGGDDVSIQLEALPSPPNFDDLARILVTVQNRPDNPTGKFNPDDPVIIQADATVGWGHVVNAFNAAVRARYTNVNFAKPGQ